MGAGGGAMIGRSLWAWLMVEMGGAWWREQVRGWKWEELEQRGGIDKGAWPKVVEGPETEGS